MDARNSAKSRSDRAPAVPSFATKDEGSARATGASKPTSRPCCTASCCKMVCAVLLIGVAYFFYKRNYGHRNLQFRMDTNNMFYTHTNVASMHRQQLSLLRELGDKLNALNATWWVDEGSLLGAYRSGDIIPHDEDVDVWIVLSGPGRKTFDREAFTVPHTPDYYGKLDVDYVKVDETNVYSHDENWPVLPKELLLPPVPGKMGDVNIFMPAQAAKYLEMRYGPDFMTPRWGYKGPKYDGKQWIPPAWLGHLLGYFADLGNDGLGVRTAVVAFAALLALCALGHACYRCFWAAEEPASTRTAAKSSYDYDV